MNNIAARGVLLIAYLFIIIVIYMVISTPFIQVVGSFEDVNSSGDVQVEEAGRMVRIVFDLMFAMAGLIPIVWFVVWCFHREPDWGYKQ